MFSTTQLMQARSTKKEGEKFSPQEEILITYTVGVIKTDKLKKQGMKLVQEFCRILGHNWTSIRFEAKERALKETSVIDNSVHKAKIIVDKYKTKIGL